MLFAANSPLPVNVKFPFTCSVSPFITTFPFAFAFTSDVVSFPFPPATFKFPFNVTFPATFSVSPLIVTVPFAFPFPSTDILFFSSTPKFPSAPSLTFPSTFLPVKLTSVLILPLLLDVIPLEFPLISLFIEILVSPNTLPSPLIFTSASTFELIFGFSTLPFPFILASKFNPISALPETLSLLPSIFVVAPTVTFVLSPSLEIAPFTFALIEVSFVSFLFPLTVTVPSFISIPDLFSFLDVYSTLPFTPTFGLEVVVSSAPILALYLTSLSFTLLTFKFLPTVTSPLSALILAPVKLASFSTLTLTSSAFIVASTTLDLLFPLTFALALTPPVVVSLTKS